MANFSSLVTTSVAGYLTAPVGDNDFALNSTAQSIGTSPALALSSVLTGNTSSDLLEQSVALKYPVVAVYCDKLSNTLKEKFRTFSGTAQAVVEVRHSQDQLQNIQATLENYVSAVCQILDASRGDWGNGVFYRGGYDVAYAPVKKGGRNFLQVAKVVFELDVSA